MRLNGLGAPATALAGVGARLLHGGARAVQAGAGLALQLADDPRRGAWSGGSRAWVEVRDRGGETYAGGVGAAVAAALQRLPGVTAVEVNAPLQRLVVHFRTPPKSLQAVLLATAHAEADWWSQHPPAGDAPARVALPGDAGPLLLRATAVGADLVGLAIAGAGTARWLPRAPSASPALTTFVDTQSRVRGALERRLGGEHADVLIGSANAVLQGAAGATSALLVETASRALALGEARANRDAWVAREPELVQYAAAPDLLEAQRAGQRPHGVADAYGELAAAGGLLAAGALAASGRPALAGAAILSSAPKASRYAQDAFAKTVGRLLCRQEGGLLLRGEALGLLGNVDTVVIDPRVLVAATTMVAEVRDASGPEREKLWRAAHADLAEGLLEAGWHGLSSLSPTRDITGIPPRARFLVTHVPEPLGLQLLDAARSAGLTLASLDVDWLGHLRSAFDELHPVGLEPLEPRPSGRDLSNEHDLPNESAALTQLVCRLQGEGRTVLVLGGTTAAVAMPAADVAVSVGKRPVWRSDVVVPGLAAAWRLVNAVPAARRVNRRGVELSAGGSLLESLLLVSPRRRPWGPVVTAGALGLVLGWRAADSEMRRPLPPVSPLFAWHAMTPDEVCRVLPPPLDRRAVSAAAPRRVPDSHGHRPGNARDLLARAVRAVREDLDDPLSPVLATGAAASAVLGSPADAVLVTSVMLGNAVLSGVQRLRAERLLAGLLATTNAPARVVVRPAPGGSDAAGEGTAYAEVPAPELCLGQVVEVRAGEVVPADLRILRAESVEVDESSLTGESLPAAKGVEATPGAPLAERTCMLYAGTVVLTGVVVAVVTATGAATEAGRAAALSPRRSSDVGLQSRLGRLTSSLLPVTAAGGMGVTALGLLRGAGIREAVTSGVAVTVAAVPEGLPLIATLAQQASARRLAATGVLVRTPAAVEALGRVQVVCFDKTGTLTENRLTVKVAHTRPGVKRPALLRAAALASPPLGGDAGTQHSTDAAVAEYAAQHRPVSDAELPFRPGRPFSAGLCGRTLAVKGAPETVLAACGASVADWPVVEELAAGGLRVLAVARRRLTDGQCRRAKADPDTLAELCSQGLELLGFLGISDTPRAGAASLLSDLAARGVRPVVVTGDHPVTATAIAAELGLEVPADQVMTGDEWAALSRKGRRVAVGGVCVFARMSPEQKVQVVQALEQAELVSAMVGDGANDAAAIRAASVGVGVATRGSDPARGAADVVLLDGRVETLAGALDEGAQLWGSVQSAVTMLLGGNAGEVAFTALGVALSGRAPLNSRQLLLVNLLTDALPAAALAVSRPRAQATVGRHGMDEEELWRRVLERGATTTLGATSAWGLARLTGRARRASTIGLVALVATQLGQTVVDAPTPLVLATAGGSLGALGLAVSTPGLSQALGCTPLGPVAWAQALGCAGAATALGAALPTPQRSAPLVSSDRLRPPAAEPAPDGRAADRPPPRPPETTTPTTRRRR